MCFLTPSVRPAADSNAPVQILSTEGNGWKRSSRASSILTSAEDIEGESFWENPDNPDNKSTMAMMGPPIDWNRSENRGASQGNPCLMLHANYRAGPRSEDRSHKTALFHSSLPALQPASDGNENGEGGKLPNSV